MFIHRQCERLCRLSGLTYHSPNVPGSGLDARRLLTDKELWRDRHGCFAPVRFFVDIPKIDDYAIILHVRDPRDVLVSMFYSYCYIHPGALQGNTGYRQAAAVRGIDSFVLAKASGGSGNFPGDYGTGGHVEDLIGDLPKRYSDYVERLIGKPNVMLLKYEEMVTNYRSWLTKFIKPFSLENESAVIDEMVGQSETYFPKRTTDALEHVRHVTPGDHKEKLRPETIEKLDEIFSGTLDALGYER